MDLDDEIARLEAELAAKDDDSDSECESSETNPGHMIIKTPLTDDDIIAPLGSKHLPTIAKKKQPVQFEKHIQDKKEWATVDASKVSQKSKAEKQAELKAYIRGYEPSERVPFACRLCGFQGSSVDELTMHRSSKEHKEKAELEQKACFCK